jgi:HK97 family phage prohead protease
MAEHLDYLIASGSASMEDLKEAGEKRVHSVKSSDQVPQVRLHSADPISIDDDTRTIRYIASDETPDRVGDIIKVSGWHLDRYAQNPVILWSHDGETIPPIGRALSMTPEAINDRPALVANIEYAPKDIHPFADTVYQLAKNGFLKATSVGFLPRKTAKLSDEERGMLGLGKYGVFYEETELLELSVVSVPANPAALQNSLKGMIKRGILSKDEVAEYLAHTDRAGDCDGLMKELCRRSFVQDGGHMSNVIRHADFLGAMRSLSNVDPVEDAITEVSENTIEKDAPVEKGPACRMADETKSECVSRKVPELIDEGMERDQAVAAANSMCETPCSEGYSAEIDQEKAVDFIRRHISNIVLNDDGNYVITHTQAEGNLIDDDQIGGPNTGPNPVTYPNAPVSGPDPSSPGKPVTPGGGKSEDGLQRTLEAVASIQEQQAEMTKAMRQLVDSLSDLTSRLATKDQGGDGGGACCAPDAPKPDAKETSSDEMAKQVSEEISSFESRIGRIFQSQDS